VTPSPPDRRCRRRRLRADPSLRGSVLLLFPAAVLIVIVLAAITVDSAIAFLGQREVANAVVGAANDAAGAGVGNRAFYEGGNVELDPVAVQQLAVDRVTAALDSDRFRDLAVDVSVGPPVTPGCPPEVRVRASARVETLFAAAVPGGPADREVHATAAARPSQADQPRC